MRSIVMQAYDIFLWSLCLRAPKVRGRGELAIAIDK